MKSSITDQTKSFLIRGLIPTLLVTALLSLGAVSAVAGGNGNAGNPGVFPPQSQPYGKSYSQWATAWVQWALSIPADRNPLLDTTGEFAGESQRGPVWFAPGTLSGSADRSFTVPEGKAIFVPVFTWIFGAAVFDCGDTAGGVPCVVCDLQELARTNTEAADVLEVFVDGVPLKNLRRYEAASPRPFPIVYPDFSLADALGGEDFRAGYYSPQVTDGYWVMLAPLAKGTHEIRIHVFAAETIYGPIEYDVIHHITVARSGHDRDEHGDCDQD